MPLHVHLAFPFLEKHNPSQEPHCKFVMHPLTAHIVKRLQKLANVEKAAWLENYVKAEASIAPVAFGVGIPVVIGFLISEGPKISQRSRC